MKLTAANWAIRDHNVTASEVAALMPGGHPYTTKSLVWMRLVGLLAQEPPSEAMATGSALEPVLIKLASERLNLRLRANSVTYQHPRVHLCATPDALVIGRRELVELKATAGHWRFADGLPADIEWQARAQMACTHRRRVYVAVLIGLGLKIWTVERHYGKERAMTQAIERFWVDHVETLIGPAEEAYDPEVIEVTEQNSTRRKT